MYFIFLFVFIFFLIVFVPNVPVALYLLQIWLLYCAYDNKHFKSLIFEESIQTQTINEVILIIILSYNYYCTSM